MKATAQVLVEVNGKRILATVTVDLPGIEPEDHINANMVLQVAASGQDRVYVSRHNKDKVVRCTLNPSMNPCRDVLPPLRLVA